MWGLTRGDLNGQGSVRVALKEGWFRGVWVGGGSYTWKIKRIGLSATSLEGGVGGGEGVSYTWKFKWTGFSASSVERG